MVKKRTSNLINERIGRRLQFIREDCLSITQLAMAQAFDIKVNRYRDIESGKTARDYAVFCRILVYLQVLDINLEDLISRTIDEGALKTRVQAARRRNLRQLPEI